MPLISEQDQALLRELFAERLTNDVTVTLFTQRESKLILPIPSQECTYCRETRELLEELTALSDKVHLTVEDFVADAREAARLGVERIPAILLEGKARGKVRFFGVPSGYEFATLIEDLFDVATGETDLEPDTRAALGAIDRDLHLQVFVTPT